MKIGKPTTKKAIGALVQTGSVVGGMMLSKGVASVIPVDNKTYVKLGLTAAGIVAAVVVDGNDNLAKAVQALCVGMSAQQASELIKEYVPAPTEDGTAVNKFINAALGSAEGQRTLPAFNPSWRMAGRMAGRMGNAAQPSVITAQSFQVA